jgi:hypothetical protein
MLNVIIIVLLIALAAPFFYYYQRESQRKKTAQAERKMLIARIERMKAKFKADVQQFESFGILSKQGQDVIYRLANYYFVFQPVTTENVAQCELLLDKLVRAVNNKLIAFDSDNPTFIVTQLKIFLQALPKQAAGYDAKFYRKELPQLIQALNNAQEVREPETEAENTAAPEPENIVAQG